MPLLKPDAPLPKARVKARAALASPTWSCEPGAEIEVPLADARRLLARGLAEELPDKKLPKASPEEAAAAAVINVQTVRSKKNRVRTTPVNAD